MTTKRTETAQDSDGKWFWRCDCGWVGYGLHGRDEAESEAGRHEVQVHLIGVAR